MLDLSFLRKRKSKWRYLVGALLFHLTVVGAFILLEFYVQREQIKDALIKFLQVKQITDDDLKRLMLHSENVDTEWADKNETAKIKKQKAYAGEKTQRVKKEIIKKGTGLGKEGRHMVFKSKGKSSGFGKILKEEEKSTLVKGSYQRLDPNLSVSTKTLLNTDQFQYSAFLNRMADSVMSPWAESALRWGEKHPKELREMRMGFYVTEIRFYFTQDGSIVKIIVEKSSGIEAFDKIALESVQKTRKLDNPPSFYFQPPLKGSFTFRFRINLTPQGFYHSTVIPDEKLEVSE